MDILSAPDYSIYGNKYALTILDDFSRYGWVFFIKNKNDSFNVVVIWYKQIMKYF